MQPENWPEKEYNFHEYGDEVVVSAYEVPAMHMSSMSEWDVFKGNSESGAGGGGGMGLVGESQKVEARAVSASNNHKEAEKRRRHRINSHLDNLRTLLPCNSKTDKATLLAKVVQRLKELKQQSSEMTKSTQLESCFPSESDDIMVVSSSNDDHQTLIIKASFCCEDRSDLIPEIVETLKSLRLSPLRAEMVTFGGRIRNVLIVKDDENSNGNSNSKSNTEEVVEFLKQALTSLVQRSTTNSHHIPPEPDRFKRQRRIR